MLEKAPREQAWVLCPEHGWQSLFSPLPDHRKTSFLVLTMLLLTSSGLLDISSPLIKGIAVVVCFLGLKKRMLPAKGPLPCREGRPGCSEHVFMWKELKRCQVDLSSPVRDHKPRPSGTFSDTESNPVRKRYSSGIYKSQTSHNWTLQHSSVQDKKPSRMGNIN